MYNKSTFQLSITQTAVAVVTDVKPNKLIRSHLCLKQFRSEFTLNRSRTMAIGVKLLTGVNLIYHKSYINRDFRKYTKFKCGGYNMVAP
jgi:hypothetical protein